MALGAQLLIKECQTALQDLAGIRWPAYELVTYLNDGQRDLVMARPDANAVTVEFVPVAGARQTLPAACLTLIDIVRNTGGNRRAIRRVDSADLDAINRDWRAMAGVTEFVHFCHDARTPNVFDLYPPAAAFGASVDMTYSAYPADIDAPSADGRAFGTVTGNLAVDDLWYTALLSYVLGRAYAKDVEYGGNVALATAYMGVFSNAMGART
jgi:hypothetical protein